MLEFTVDVPMTISRAYNIFGKIALSCDRSIDVREKLVQPLRILSNVTACAAKIQEI